MHTLHCLHTALLILRCEQHCFAWPEDPHIGPHHLPSDCERAGHDVCVWPPSRSPTQSALQVLGNAAKRQVYDIYGKEGLAAGLQVVPSGKSTEELKKDWEGFRTQQVHLAFAQPAKTCNARLAWTARDGCCRADMAQYEL